MKKLLLILVLFINAGSSLAQKQGSELIDSLKSKLNSSAEDTSKVRLLGRLSFQYFNFDTDLGIYYGEQAFKLAEKLEWGLGLAFSLNYLGTNYAVKGNYPKALEYFDKSLSKYKEIGNKQGIAFLSNNLGNFYRIQKNYKKAIEYINDAIAINKELNNRLDLVKNYNNLGSVYSAIPELGKSNDYYVKALKLAREIGNNGMIALLLLNIAEIREKVKDYCGALELSLEAIRINEKINITYDKAVNYGYVGQIYLEIASDSTNSHLNCKYYSNDKTANLLLAKKYLVAAINLLVKINDLASLSENSLLLSNVYEKLGDSRNALLYYKKYSEYKDSVFSKDKSIELLNVEKKREVELRDKQIIIQSLAIDKKNSQIFSQIVLFISILFLTSFIPYFYYRKRKKQEAARTELAKMKANKLLIESEEQFRAVSEHSFNSICIINEAGKIIWVNEAMQQMGGYSKEQIYSAESFVSFIALESIDFVVTNFTKFVKEEDYIHHYDFFFIRSDGEKRLCEKFMSCFKDRNDNKNLVISMMDITERKRVETELEIYRNNLEELVRKRTDEWEEANEKLKVQIEKQKQYEMMLQQSLIKEQELNEMKSRFISTTTHEFKTPLTSVLLSAELLQRYMKKWDEEKKNDHLERIKNSVRNLSNLLDDLLTISRSESGKIAYNPEKCDLKKLGTSCVIEAQNLSLSHRIEFTYQSSQTEILLDEKLMKFVFNNLLSNAIKYSPAGGKVDLTILTDENNFIIKVSDEGIGIPSEETERIFDSFYRSKNAEDIKGTGLGLAIVKRAVELHKGEISLESVLNRGTTFTVKIPFKL